MVYGNRLWGSAPSPVFEADGGAGSSPGETPPAVPEPSAIPLAAEGATGASAPTPAPEPSPAPEPTQPPKKDWKEARLAKQTATIHELKAEVERLRAGAQAPGATAAPTPTQAPDLETAVQAEVAKREFLKSCQDTATEGRKTYTDFDARIGNLAQLINPADVAEVTQYNTMLASAIDTGKGAEVLHVLGGDPDEAARILALPPAKMAVELTKIALKAPEATSTAAPRPIPGVGGRGAAAELIDPTDAGRADKLSTAEWMKRRGEQVAGKGRYERVRR